jgi:uridine kinase
MSKRFYNLTDMTNKDSLIIGIAGGTASGKTTLSQLLKELAGFEQAEIIYLDSYYRSQDHLDFQARTETNYDHPDAFEIDLLIENLKQLKFSKSIKAPNYNFVEHTRSKEPMIIEPKPILIVEGFLTLYYPELLELFDLKVFVDASTAVRKQRRLTRDIHERGRTAESVELQWNTTVEPMHQKYCEPSKGNADIIIDGESPYFEDLALELLQKICSNPKI